MVVQRADVLGDRHFVIVEDNQHVRLDIARVVHGFKSHPGGDRPVANHADGAALLILFSAATAIPMPAEMEVDEWPTLSTSYSLSPRHGTGAGRPSDEWCQFYRDVRSEFCADKRWPTSQIS